MKRATAVLRHYTTADAVMRQNMRTMHAHYTTHQAAFAAFNPEFDPAFGTDWLAAIDAADTTPDNTVRTGELMEDTTEVTDVMEQARTAVQSVFYYVGRAFPHNAGRLEQYGRSTYVAARDNHDRMRTLLKTAFTSATRDKAPLAAKGYSAPQLATLGTLVEQLATTNTTQEVTKGTNVEGTDHYVTTQNLAYGYGQEASAAAKLLFAEDAATLALFRLGGPAASSPESHEVSVGPGDVASITFDTALLATTRLHLRLAVPTAGQVALVGRVVAAGDKLTLRATLTAGTSELTVPAAELGLAGQVLQVQNDGPEAVRVEMALA
ncbi:hypothetical protein [Hymenobacter terricola]|uniref:hypothetical protein n=1 Tax=Hymenobacter terricola TaxID=2819236 RepID=UPI001B30D2E3|nr:hypothetical protein [Hymenobacter terricola]